MTMRRVAIGVLALLALIVLFVVFTYFGTTSTETGTGTMPG